MAVDDITLTGASESLNAGFTKVNAAWKAFPIIENGSTKQYLRIINLTIEDGTLASSIKVTGASVCNGDAIEAEDSIQRDDSATYVSLDVNGNILTIDNSGLSGNCLFVLSAEIYRNAGGNFPYIDGEASSNNIQLTFRNNDDSAYDLPNHVDVGSIYARVAYITDA